MNSHSCFHFWSDKINSHSRFHFCIDKLNSHSHFCTDKLNSHFHSHFWSDKMYSYSRSHFWSDEMNSHSRFHSRFWTDEANAKSDAAGGEVAGGSGGSSTVMNLGGASSSSSLSALDNFYQSHLPTQSPFDFRHAGTIGLVRKALKWIISQWMNHERLKLKFDTAISMIYEPFEFWANFYITQLQNSAVLILLVFWFWNLHY